MLKTQSLPSDYFLYLLKVLRQTPPPTPQTSATNQGPRAQLCEPMEDILIQTTTSNYLLRKQYETLGRAFKDTLEFFPRVVG